MRLIDADALVKDGYVLHRTYQQMDDMISRQVALDTLREAENHAFNGYYKGLAKAHKIVANLASAQPTQTSVVATQDCISRQAAIDAIIAKLDSIDHVPQWVFDELTGVIGNLPSAQSEVAEDINALINGFISRLAEINAIENTDCELPPYAWDKLTDAIMSVTSAQPEIIYCKDCKHVGTDATCCLVCNREGMGLKPYHVYHDDFCSYAERKTDD